MLRETAIKILRSKVNARTAYRGSEALTSSFNPRVSWYDKASFIHRLFHYKNHCTSRDFTMEKMAKFLNLDLSYVIKLNSLYVSTLTYPRLKYIPNWHDAYVLSNEKEDRLYKIERYLAMRGIVPESIDNNE